MNIADETGLTPLLWAANQGHVKVVEMLLWAGATLESDALSHIEKVVDPKLQQLLLRVQREGTRFTYCSRLFTAWIQDSGRDAGAHTAGTPLDAV